MRPEFGENMPGSGDSRNSGLSFWSSARLGTTPQTPQDMRCGRGCASLGPAERYPRGSLSDGVRLDNGMRLKNQELLRATRPSHAVTYASCQGLTLHNRVRLDLESCHLTLLHLYVGASRARAPSCWRRPSRTGSTAPPRAPA